MQILNLSKTRLVVACAMPITGLITQYGLVNIWHYLDSSLPPTAMVTGLALGFLVLASGVLGVLRFLFFVAAAVAAGFAAWMAWAPFDGLLKAAAQFEQAYQGPEITPAFRLSEFFRYVQGSLKFYSAYYTTLAGLVATPILSVALGIRLVLLHVPRDQVVSSGPWTAQWMSGAPLRYLMSRTHGLPLGLKDGTIIRYEPDPAKGWRGGHHAIIAGTRAGKGVGGAIPAILDSQGPVVVLDVKGEHFAVTRRYREAQGRRVVVLNPFSVIEPTSDGYNPLGYLRRDHLVRDIGVLAEGLVVPETGTNAHFSDMARQLIAAAIEVVVTLCEAHLQNLNTVADLLLAPGLAQRLATWEASPDYFGRRPAQAAATFLSTGENERGAIRTTVTKAFEWAKSDEMRAFLARSDVHMDDLLNDRIDVFIVIPLDQIGQQAVFMRLLINIILGAVVRQDGHRRAAKPILMVLDEFVRLGRMEKLIDLANVAAGAGIEALFITQDKGQVEAVYGRNDTDSLFGACVTTRIFGLGRLESHTAEWAADALGDGTILSRSVQAPSRFHEASRTSYSEQRQKLMTADQILQMPPDQMLCLIGSKPPLKLKAIVSHAHAAYRGKLDPNPTLRG